MLPTLTQLREAFNQSEEIGTIVERNRILEAMLKINIPLALWDDIYKIIMNK